MRLNSGWSGRFSLLRQQISFCSEQRTCLRQLAAGRCSPELMSWRPFPQEERCRASVPQHFPLHSLKHRAAVERWLFGPAEHPQQRRETDSESSWRLPELEFQAGPLTSIVAMTQLREAMPKCFEWFESLAGLPLVKNPAHQPERQLALAFGCHEPTCRLRTEKAGAQLQLPAKAGYQPPPRFAGGVSAALFSAAERLSSREYRSDPTMRVGAQFCRAIRGSFQSRLVNLLDAD